MSRSFFVCALLILAAAARADGFSVLGRELSSAALKAGMQRVVVLPFSPADSSSARDGRILAEKLTTQVVRSGGIRTMERALLSNLTEERRRERIGQVEASGPPEGVGSAADGIITASFFSLGRDFSVQARLINVETGAIVAASERRVEKDWADGLDPSSDDALPENCAGSEEVVDRIESQMLDLKARYWALQMRRGVSLSSLRVFPGEAISDNELRQKLYDRMNDWYGRRRVPELDVIELQRLLSLDRLASVLHRGCPSRARKIP